MTELERINNIEEQITLAGLLPGVNLRCLPPEESPKLKRAALDLYRLGHASGFKAGIDHAITGAVPLRRAALQLQCLKRWLPTRMRERWQGFKTSMRRIRATVIRDPRRRSYQTAALSDNSAIRR
jgi:hypothetical protein